MRHHDKHPFHAHPFFRQHRRLHRHTGQDGLTPLVEMEAEDQGIVEEIFGGREVANRLLALGFAPGMPFEVKNNYHRGPIIVFINDTKVAVGRGEANKILVKRKK
jgi:ferrous iron transport protein A